ncbi:MAG: transposase [Candidatus Aminicenantes bacterium]|nr:transposase [Candidatus Aminicenantes bacterium]
MTFLAAEGRVGYRFGRDGAEQEGTDYLELIARVTSHIPDKDQVMVRYYGLYANAHGGRIKKAGANPLRGRPEECLNRRPAGDSIPS